MTWLLNKLTKSWENTKHIWLWPWHGLLAVLHWLFMATLVFCAVICMIFWLLFWKKK